jgi:hypothetical protein
MWLVFPWQPGWFRTSAVRRTREVRLPEWGGSRTAPTMEEQPSAGRQQRRRPLRRAMPKKAKPKAKKAAAPKPKSKSKKKGK